MPETGRSFADDSSCPHGLYGWVCDQATRNRNVRRRVVDTSNTPSCSILGCSEEYEPVMETSALVNPVIDVAVSVISGGYAETTELTARSPRRRHGRYSQIV
jgi:hypothetical protein